MPPYQLVFEKAYHLLVELEHRALWAIKKFNFDIKNVGSNRRLQLNELDEQRNEAYENSWIYKDQTKAYHDKYISKKTFELDQKVWLYNSRLHLFPRKLQSCWNGSYVVTQVFPHGAIEIKDTKIENTFKVNGQHLKLYMKEINEREQIDAIDLVDPIYPPS